MVFELIARIGIYPASQGAWSMEWNQRDDVVGTGQNVRVKRSRGSIKMQTKHAGGIQRLGGKKIFETEAECYRSFFVRSGMVVRRKRKIDEEEWRRTKGNRSTSISTWNEKKGGRKEKKIKTDKKKKKRKRRGPYTRVLLVSILFSLSLREYASTHPLS